ncbi:uncharacterized protein LOC130134415 isoform X1 [Syzygium oleosum]|uniref:uncharacterized protein LOC130134415 isoform X1 n=1 Tax=Syzygium oleosum TaxID=219896 RepID=UPI0024BBDF98|nr:uncharacterized protein LOC130134415 isoform X1 [Syzygium oleosum]
MSESVLLTLFPSCSTCALRKILLQSKRSYIEGPDEYLSRATYINKDSPKLTSARYTSGKINDDIKILLQCTSPLLWSYNSAVVVAAATVHWIMAPMEDVKRIVKPLLFVLRSSNASRYVLINVGQKQDALQELHDLITLKRSRAWQNTLERIMFKYIELCVDMRRGRFAKDGLIEYRIVCQQVNVTSLEEVTKHSMQTLQEKAEQAQD